MYIYVCVHIHAKQGQVAALFYKAAEAVLCGVTDRGGGGGGVANTTRSPPLT